MRIVIPSMSRAKSVLTKNLLTNYEICVPESQADEYAEYTPAEHIITHPDTVIGLTNKWQWMIDNLFTDEALVMFDDDISHVIRLSSFSDEVGGGKWSKRVTDPLVIEGIIDQVVNTAIDMNVQCFGWNIMPHAIQFNTGFKPFELSGCVHGAAMGFIKNHNLSYNSEFLLKGDYWVSLLNTYLNRMTLIDDRFAFAAEDTFVGQGGQSLHRTTEREQSELKLLQKYFGRDVVSAGHKKGRGRQKEYMGIESISIKLPF